MIAVSALVIGAVQVALVAVLRSRGRHRNAELATEVATTAGGIRRRITEQRLGLTTGPAPARGRRQR